MVQNITVVHLVREHLVSSVGSDDYHLCMNEDCDVVYFQLGQILFKDDLTIPVWFKTNANPKYICYCNNVSQKQIEDAVINHKANNLKDIIKLTGAMKNGKCLHHNPTGKCCGPVIQEIINNLKVKF